MSKVILKKPSIFFLKVAILLFAFFVLTGLLLFPQTEGRAKNLDLLSIYKDPFIIYIYIGSLPFFVGLYQIFKLLNLIETKKIFSKEAINTLKNIQLEAFFLIVFIILALLYIRFFILGDDQAGPSALGAFAIFACGAVATATAVFQKLIQNARDLKSK